MTNPCHLRIDGDQEVNYLKRNFNYPIFTQVVETVRAWNQPPHYAESQRLRCCGDSLLPGRQRESEALLEKARKEKRDLFIHEAAEILGFYGIPWSGNPVSNETEAVQAAKQLGFPWP